MNFEQINFNSHKSQFKRFSRNTVCVGITYEQLMIKLRHMDTSWRK